MKQRIALVASAIVLHASLALAQSQLPVREQILGYDPNTHMLRYVRRGSGGETGYAHVFVADARLDGTVEERQVTTPQEAQAIRAGAGAMAARQLAEARAEREVAAARAGLVEGNVLPVRFEGASGCVAGAVPMRRFVIGPNRAIEVSIDRDSLQSTLTLVHEDRRGTPVALAAVSLIVPGDTLPRVVAYDRVVDVREIPGTDQVALMLRGDACLPAGVLVPVTARLLQAPTPADRPFAAATRGEAVEPLQLLRAIVGRNVRMRNRDGTPEYTSGPDRLVLDDAWMWEGPWEEDRMIVQFTRFGPGMDVATEGQGRAPASLAVLERERRAWKVVSILTPHDTEAIFQGTARSAGIADMDGDHAPEILLRTRVLPAGTVGYVLRWNGHDIRLIWRGVTDGPMRGAPGHREVQRACTVGWQPAVVIARCTETAAGGAIERVVQRVTWDDGGSHTREERW